MFRKALDLLFLTGLITICLNIFGCSAIFPDSKQLIPIDQLVIDASAFPEGWGADKLDTEFPPLAPWSFGRNEVEYADGADGRAFMRIQRFNNPLAASREYERTIEVAFRDTRWNTSWVVPNELVFKSNDADRSHYACSMEGTAPHARHTCAYVAQYKEYNIEFYVDFWNTNVITYIELNQIFQSIDQKMSMAVDGK